MKRIHTILPLTVILLYACTVTELSETKRDAQLFTAFFEEQDETKTYVDNNLYMFWTENDRISLFQTSLNEEYSFEGKTGDRLGTFRKSNPSQTGSGNTLLNNYAVYPYSSTTQMTEDGEISLTLPSVQKYAFGSFGLGANTMVAVTNGLQDHNLSFMNVCGYLVVKLYGKGTVKSISIRGNDKESLAGPASISFSSHTDPSIWFKTNGTGSISLDCGDGVLLGEDASQATEFWFCIPPRNYSKGFTVIVTNSEGYSMVKSTEPLYSFYRNEKVSMTALEAKFDTKLEFIEIKDASFKAYCVKNFDTDGDGEISNIEALGIDEINLESDDVTSLAGIENFINLTKLTANPKHKSEYGSGIGDDWRDSGFTNDDYNGYNKVTIVRGKIEQLDLSGNKRLQVLDCSGNALTEVNLSNCEDLEKIRLKYNYDLSTIDFGDKKKLRELELRATSIDFLDVSSFVELRKLQIDRGLEISSGTIDLSNNPKITYLQLDSRGIDVIDVSKNTELLELYIHGNNLKELNVKNNTKLEHLDFSFNRIKEIDLSNNAELVSLFFQNNEISSVNLKNLSKLQNVHVGNYRKASDGSIIVNTISEIDFSGNPNLQRVFCSLVDVKKIDLSNQQHLICFDCAYNNLVEEIDVSSSIGLETLDCRYCPALTKIYVNPAQTFSCEKDATAHYYYKGEGSRPYSSTDFSQNGVVKTLQTANRGKGINMVLMGDAFSDRLIADGTYDDIMSQTMDAFFSVEPYKTYRDMFNVYSITAVSLNETYSGIHESALNTYFGEDTFVGGDDATVFDLAQSIPNFNSDKSIICVIMNEKAYAGTCDMYYSYKLDKDGHIVLDTQNGNGAAIAYFPLGTDNEMFSMLVHHEAGGHAFAKLADEYYYSGSGTITEQDSSDLAFKHSMNWYTNVDTQSDVNSIKWGKFIKDSRYSSQGIGIYEGAYYYEKGVYRPTEDGIMNTTQGQFNAPSREAIYNRLHKLAYGDEWNFDYETFVSYDVINVQNTTKAHQGIRKNLPPLHAPVIHNQSWQSVKPMKKGSVRSKSTSNIREFPASGNTNFSKIGKSQSGIQPDGSVFF